MCSWSQAILSVARCKILHSFNLVSTSVIAGQLTNIMEKPEHLCTDRLPLVNIAGVCLLPLSSQLLRACHDLSKEGHVKLSTSQLLTLYSSLEDIINGEPL